MCKRKDILKEFLERYSTEVENMIFTEFNQVVYGDVRESEGMEKGIKKGIKKGMEETYLSLVLDGDIDREKAMSKMRVTHEEFERLFNNYKEKYGKNDIEL